MAHLLATFILIAGIWCHASTQEAAARTPFRIVVVDSETGQPVPLIELRTTGNLRFITDNAGVIAIDAPELMNRETWFAVIADGYEVPPDGFGFRGARLTPVAGESAVLEVTRTSIAQRLGRITGAGLFAESRKLGDALDWRESGVVGCDSVQNAVHHDRLFWLWGDTTLFDYPLGVFDATAATTPLHPIETFEPPLRLELDLFRDQRGRPRGVAPMPGGGPTWLTGLVSLPDEDGNARLVAFYAKVRQPMNIHRWGLCAWNDEQEAFEHIAMAWREEIRADGKPASGEAQAPMSPELPPGHATLWTDDAGAEWVLFGNPFPVVRCRATFEQWRDVDSWERLTPQKTLPVAPTAAAGAEAHADDAAEVEPHSGSIAWHPWRRRWVTIFTQKWGSPSAFGEVWYAEADSPMGPWGTAVKVLSHANYTFYNPRIHSEWLEADSPTLIFEGTYSQMFADKPQPTPRYDYNQILYRIDLDDEALRAARE